MKRFIAVAIATLVGPTFAGRASAHDQAGAGSAHKPMMMDQDGDDRVSRDEHQARAREMFETMDADGDGKVTAAEMNAAHEQIRGKKLRRAGASAADKIKRMDTDGDGALSAEEHGASARQVFSEMDEDSDGFLTRDEMGNAHRRMGAKTSRP